MKNLTHNRFSILISAAFLALSILLVWHHQIWMDEAYHYLLPRDSSSLGELYRNAAPGGHPLLWNVLLFYAGHVFPGVLPAQLLHSAIACCCVFLINRYSPFKRTENVLISFGYFFLYEYNIIAKNYMPGICLVFVGLALYTQKKPLLWIALVLALAGNAHFFSMFVALTVFIYIVCKRKQQESTRQLLTACLIMGAGVIFTCIQVLPDPESIGTYKSLDAAPVLSLDRIGKTLAFMCRGLLNIPDFRLDSFWNSNILFNINRISCYALSALLVVVIFLQFRRDKLILLLYFVPLLLIMGFLYMAPIAVGTRYWGYSYIILIICTWAYRLEYTSETRFPGVFKFIILMQFLVSVPVVVIALSRPFSNAKYAARSLEKAQLEKIPLFIQDLGSGPALSAYANKKVYYPSNNLYASYAYVGNSKDIPAQDFISESVHDLKGMYADSCVLVMRAPLDRAFLLPNTGYDLKKIAFHEGALISSEDYYLYLLSIH